MPGVGLREISRQPLCKLFGVISLFFLYKIISHGLKPWRAKAALSAPGDWGATGALCSCLWYFPSKTRLVAGEPHDRCRLGGNSYIISCRSHGLIYPPAFTLCPARSMLSGSIRSTNSAPGNICIHRVLSALPRGLDPARTQQHSGGIKCLNSHSE